MARQLGGKARGRVARDRSRREAGGAVGRRPARRTASVDRRRPAKGARRSAAREPLAPAYGIDARHASLLARYRSVFDRGAQALAEVFYASLPGASLSCGRASDHTAGRGRFEALIARHATHFREMLKGGDGRQYDTRVARLGAAHHRYGIEPARIVTGYLRCLDHASHLARHEPEVEAEDRSDLEIACARVLLRDLARITRGYWGAARRTNALAHERLDKLITTDALTGLPNRMLFRDRLAQAIGMVRREAGRGAVVMMMDLDHFKEVNDTLGHEVGDRILVEVARRVSSVLRSTDTVTRLGGDEFAMLMSDTADSGRTAENAAGKLVAELARPFSDAGRELFLGASIGIAVYPEHGDEVDTLLGRADAAMVACKGRDARYLFYDDSLDARAPQRLQLATEIHRSLERGELLLHYQPIASLRERRIIGVEALIRWNHPQRGLIGPDEFVPVAERSGLIKPITDWVIETSLRQAASWRRRGLSLRISVNVSGRVFRDPLFLQRVENLLSTAGADTDCLEIEVTENVLMSEVDEVARTLVALNRIGIRAAIDDFGTGYTSLAHLKRLPIDRLKIDKSLVRDMTRDESDGPIVRAIIDLAHNLGREVVAEGVENTDVRALLDVLGCDAIQGFHLSRPLPAAEVEPWLRDCGLAAGYN
jgi:diguanylate cyclase (GGDEF)-like protein